MEEIREVLERSSEESPESSTKESCKNPDKNRVQDAKSDEARSRSSSIITSDTSCNSTFAPNKNYGIKLIRFFIYCPNFGPKEGQEAKKIIYFYDSDQVRNAASAEQSFETLESQIKHVGLTEAAIRFAATFSQYKDSCALGMHTQKTKSIYLEPEKDFFMILTVTVPRTKRRKHSRTAELSTSPTYEYAYSPDDVHENVLRAILLRAYDMFKLFCGGFQYQLKINCDGNLEEFKKNVKSFFKRYVSSSMVHIVDKADLCLSLFGGVQFLTLQSSAFLKVHSFISRIEDEFRPNIEATLFFHHGNIVWSGLQQRETALLFQYINTSLLPSTVLASTSEKSSSTSQIYETTSRSPFTGHQGRFLTGIPGTRFNADMKLPKIFVPPTSAFGTENVTLQDDKNECQLREYHLIVYHALTSTVCLIVPAEIEITNKMMERLDAHMGSRLTNMSADLLDVFGRGGLHLSSSSSNPSLACPPFSSLTPQGALEQNLKDLGFSSSHQASSSGIGDSSSNANVRFIYYNGTNKAMKNTLFLTVGKPGGNNGIPSWSSVSHSTIENQIQGSEGTSLRDEIHVIADMRSHFDKIAKRW